MECGGELLLLLLWAVCKLDGLEVLIVGGECSMWG